MNSLGERLKSSTRAIHVQVERSALMQALFRRQLGRPGYCVFLRNLFEIYAALEEALRAHAQLPELSPLVLPQLFRADRLAADLEVMQGPGWRTSLPVMPEALAYAQHLRALSAAQPALLGAHVYVRSLGDLSGGQMLQKIVTQTLGQGGPLATSFYDFGEADEVKALAHTLRGAINSVPGGEQGEAAFVGEANSGFERHRALFGELAQASGISVN
jgi:heme oxygenase